MTREERRLKSKSIEHKPETKHLFIGGWENFDLDSFCKGRSVKDRRLKENRICV